ncbi:MAG: hypothetical protein WA885_06080 [Phormidesmis sp.]
MAFSDFSDSIVDRFTHRMTDVCQRWGIKPISLLDSIALWLEWTGLTWLAFWVSLLFIEVGEKGDISLVDGLVGGGLIGLSQWQVLKAYVRRAHYWIVASTLSWGAFALLHIGAIGWMAPGSPNLAVRGVLGVVYGGYVGLLLGLGQWMVIRQQVVRAWRWIPLNAGVWAVAIALGWLVGGGLRMASNLFVSEVVGLVVSWGAIAALSGIGMVTMLSQTLPSK